MSYEIAKPGSEEAYEKGCVCPIRENDYVQKGFIQIYSDCPLHGDDPEKHYLVGVHTKNGERFRDA